MHEIMEFILPVVFASGEAMIWILLFVALVLIGRGKLLPSEKTLVIERKGQYRMVLAPELNLAQAFIESIAAQIALREAVTPDSAVLCFEVRDKHIATRKHPAYLLDISIRDGMLHFATRPATSPATPNASKLLAALEVIETAVHSAAGARGISLQRIAPAM
jgi:hypothetical protein